MEHINESQPNPAEKPAASHEPFTPHIDSLAEMAESSEEQEFIARRIRVLYGIARARNSRTFRRQDAVIAERRVAREIFEQEQRRSSENTDDVL
jgi:hypothetical protein